jgi:hypothetical protein
MSAPRRIQRSRAKGWRAPAGTVYVGRPGPWGNPFIVGRDGTAEDCVRLYSYLMGGALICLTSKATVKEQQRAKAYVIAHIAELRGKDLMCWCRVGKPCHADVLLHAANLKKPIISREEFDRRVRIEAKERIGAEA